MNMSPSDFIFTHNTESTESAELIISNAGGSNLDWELDYQSVEGRPDNWMYFIKPDYGDTGLEDNQDRVTDNVWITRDNSGPIFNYYQENEPEYGCNSQTPTATLWSPYPKEHSNVNNYSAFINMTGCCPPCMVGDTVSVWILTDDLKLNVVFESWTSGGQGGGFSYYREETNPQWLEIDPTDGTILAGEEQTVIVTVNSVGLDEGEHSASLQVNSNDPENHTQSIPVDLVYFLDIDSDQLPREYALYPTYPNPFNPSTTIRLDVPESINNNVALNVFDIRGRLVETILDKKLAPGSYAIRWDAKSKSSGVYFLRMNTERYTKIHKMILMK
jgi:hypothetical protein